jgi:predicted nucleic acid-binding protein
MDLALPKDVAHDALDIIRSRLPESETAILPTVMGEITHLADQTANPQLGEQAREAIRRASSVWKMQPIELDDVQASIAGSVAGKLLERGIIPRHEINDALILAEAAVAGCQILLSADSHVRDADRTRMALLLQSCDVPVVVCCTPREIVAMFGGRRKR